MTPLPLVHYCRLCSGDPEMVASVLCRAWDAVENGLCVVETRTRSRTHAPPSYTASAHREVMHTPSAAAPTYRSVSISLHKHKFKWVSKKMTSLLAYFVLFRVVFSGIFCATSTDTSVGQLIGM
jgi:hypothetical protein